MMSDNDFKHLINKVKGTEIKPVIQKVLPVEKVKKEEIQFNFYIEKQLLKKIKIQSIEKNMSIKEIINKSLIQYLEKTT